MSDERIEGAARASLFDTGTRAERKLLSKEAWQVIAFTVLCVAAAIFIPPMPQALEYHGFADARPFFGVPNFMDVASNVFFVIAGLAGLVATIRCHDAFAWSAERVPYAVFFFGITLTGFGSAYYHLAPSNETLVWDRLPMTIAFSSLIAAQIGDRISPRAGLAVLVPALALGIWTVMYWISTERAGAGNVVPYAVLQGYAMVILLAMALLHKSRYTHGRDIAWVFVAYLLAKAFETFDHEVFALGGVVSGHTLKHVAAAVAAMIVVRMIAGRRLRHTAAPA